MQSICLRNEAWGHLTALFYHQLRFSDTIDCDKLQKSHQVWTRWVENTAIVFFPSLNSSFPGPAPSMKGRYFFPPSPFSPAIIQTLSLLEVSKGKVEICDPLSSSSMEGWAPARLPVSDASTDNARGKMATVHPGACILKLLLPAAFRWGLIA